jgi:hypothetical protein
MHDATGVMHSGPANDCDHLAKSDRASRHARGFSFKVPAKPVIKTGAGVSQDSWVSLLTMQASQVQGQG